VTQRGCLLRELPTAAWAIVAAAVPMHLMLALGTDLSPDEAYYLCAARLGRPVADHPPLTVWLLSASDHWSFLPVELRVRVWAIGLSLATSLGLVALARLRGAGREGCTLAAWLGTWALLPMAGGFVTTPDSPLLVAAVLALLFAGRSAGGVGASLWAGTLAKVVALPLGALVALGGGEVRERQRRGSLGGAHRWAAVAGPVLALPLVLTSLRFQVQHAFAPPVAWSLRRAAVAVVAASGAQALLWSPQVLGHALLGARVLPRCDRAVLAGFTAMVAISAGLRAVPPEPNWWAPAAVVAVVATAVRANQLSVTSRRALLATVLVPTAVALAHTLHPFLPLSPSADPGARLHGWREAHPPSDAPGVGVYGASAERCVYHAQCHEILSYFNQMNPEGESHR
jgi:hypothetical protein